MRFFFFVTLLLTARLVAAQTFELGLQLSSMHLHKIDETPLGVGGRLHYNFRRMLAADVELTHFPENPSGNFGETLALFGARLGTRLDRFGVFANARPGFIHFGGDYFNTRLDHKTHLAFDTGATLEFYPTRKTFIRIDIDDTVIYFGQTRLFDRPNPDALGTIHNLRPAVGLGVRF
jgi:hypothetical protein